MSTVLADTGGLYSLLNRRDEHHAEAIAFYNALSRQSEVVIIEYILVELMTLLRARGFSGLAIQPNGPANWLASNQNDEAATCSPSTTNG